MTNLLPRIEFLFQAIYKNQNFCPYCRSYESTVLASKYRFIKIKQCSRCYLCYTSPIYQPILSNNLYNRFYAGEGSTTNLPSDDQLIKLLKTSFKDSDKSIHNLKERRDNLNTRVEKAANI